MNTTSVNSRPCVLKQVHLRVIVPRMVKIVGDGCREEFQQICSGQSGLQATQVNDTIHLCAGGVDRTG